MYTIAVSRIVRFGFVALISMGALLLATAAFARHRNDGCWNVTTVVASCESEGHGCWRNAIVAHCPNGSQTVLWQSPWCWDDNDADLQAIMDDMCTSVSSDGGYGIPPGTAPPFDFVISPPAMTQDPCGGLPFIEEYDFPDDGQGVIFATRHGNGCGIVAEETAWVHPDAYVAPAALVYGNAKVGEGSQIMDNARVSGNAIVRESFVKDDAVVKGSAVLRYGSVVSGDAMVDGDARLECGAIVEDEAVVKDHARVEGYELDGGDRVAGEDCGEYAMSERPGRVTETGQLSDCALIEDGEVVSEGVYGEPCP